MELKYNLTFERLYKYSYIIFAFSLPLSRGSISFFIVLLPLIWLLEGGFKNKIEKIKSQKILLFFFIYLFYLICSSFWSEDITKALNMIRMTSYFFLIFIFFTSIKRENIDLIINAFLMGMFVSEVVVYGVLFGFWQIGNATPTYLSPFMMHIDYSIFLAFTSLLLMNRVLLKKYSLYEKFIFLFFFLTVTGNLFLSIGRTGQLALVFGIIILFIIHFKISLKSMISSILVTIVVFTAAYQVSDNFQTRVSETVNELKDIKAGNLNGSWGIRIAYWITSYNLMGNNLFGYGIGDFEQVISNELKDEKYNYLSIETKEFMSKHHPHNQYLLILLQIGIIGLILFLYIIYLLFKLHIVDEEFKKGSIVFLVVYLVGCMAEPLFNKQFTLVLFILFISIFLLKEEKSFEINKN